MNKNEAFCCCSKLAILYIFFLYDVCTEDLHSRLCIGTAVKKEPEGHLPKNLERQREKNQLYKRYYTTYSWILILPSMVSTEIS